MIKPKIVVERYLSEKDWTLSEFYINGDRRAYGVEDEYREKKVHGETRIPNGVYELGLRDSPHFSHEYFVDSSGRLSKTMIGDFKTPHQMIWVKDVPDFEYVLIHWGNTDLDSSGCFIIGSSLAEIVDAKGVHRKGVGGSRAKYTEIYPEIWRMITSAKESGEKVYIEYKDKTKLLT